MFEGLTGSVGPIFGVLIAATIIISIYVLVTIKFSRFIGTRNIIGLNLQQYNNARHPFFEKILGAGLYIIEYLVLAPFLAVLWLLAFLLLVTLLSEDLSGTTIMLIATLTVAVIRIMAYYQEDVAIDVAKVLPFALLAIYLSSSKLSTIIGVGEAVQEIIKNLPLLSVYFLFIVLLEIGLRLLNLVGSLITGDFQKLEKG